MKAYLVVLGLAVIVAALLLVPQAQQPAVAAGDYFYGITKAGVLCGYAVIDTSLAVVDGDTLMVLEQVVVSRNRLLGMDIDSEVAIVFHVDPGSGQFLYHEFTADQGQRQFGATVRVDADGAHCTSSFGRPDAVVALPTDVLLENTLFLPRLLADFTGPDAPDRTYQVFDLGDQQIHAVACSWAGEEIFEAAGVEQHTVMVDRRDLVTGVRTRTWLARGTGLVVKVLQHDGPIIALSEPVRPDLLKRFDGDPSILTPTNVSIADVPGITSLTVRAVLEPTGLIPSADGLNVPGQRFTGTVVGNRIEGIFEIEHPHYDGTGSPPFPAATNDDPDLARYLAPGPFIESDDPGIAAMARDVTDGAPDAWQAARRLSAWVSSEIAYAIPGGGTARGVFEIRAGECGGHSMLLAAFCRAVGIPARVVWGVVYTPGDGGRFGQHGWTEVHMGPAGWIAVDATGVETDFVDSGHIRLGEYASFATRAGGREFEILDYRIAGASDAATAAAETRYAPYLGTYTLKGLPEPAEIVVQDGSLVMVIPGRATLAFDDPDDRGRWSCKLARHIFLEFVMDQPGHVVELCLHELHDLRRQPGPAGGDEVPAADRLFPGRYRLAAIDADFTVSADRGQLCVHHPLEDRTWVLDEPDADGWRAASDGRHAIRFSGGVDGQVAIMTIDGMSRFTR